MSRVRLEPTGDTAAQPRGNAKRRKQPPAPAWGDEPLWIDPELERRIATSRPQPPDTCAEDAPEWFAPDLVFAEWIRETFVAGGGPLENEDHQHLLDAKVGVLWTNAVNIRQMRHILATAEMPLALAMGGKWKRARQEQQLREWFEVVPDFLITFYAPECARIDDRAFCALVEHEIYHCAQAEDQYGAPKFSRDTGAPIYSLRGHDVEEFVGVVRRYGSTSPEVRELVRVANARPMINDAAIAKACGTCAARAA